MNVPVIIVSVQLRVICLHWKWAACRWNRTGSAPCWTSGAERRSRSCTPPLCVLSCEPAVWPGSTKYSTQVKASASNSTFGIMNHWKGRVKKKMKKSQFASLLPFQHPPSWHWYPDRFSPRTAPPAPLLSTLSQIAFYSGGQKREMFSHLPQLAENFAWIKEDEFVLFWGARKYLKA